jgi:hypothetical protein
MTMLVAVTGFASIWRTRFRKDTDDEERFARGAYFNTTGVTVNGSLRQRPGILGYVRFDGAGGFNPNFPSRMVNSVFECAAPGVWNGANKILFRRILPLNEAPDRFLVVTQTGFPGTLLIGEENWRSDGTFLLSLSEHRDLQEAMLLMSASSWIRTALGTFVLEPGPNPGSATLRLRNCAKCALSGRHHSTQRRA